MTQFFYTVDADASEPVMLLDNEIGNTEDGKGIQGGQFGREILQLASLGKKRIKVVINSIGGSVIDGANIYHAILNSPIPVDTFCGVLAASMAAVIFQAGKTRTMADYGNLMYHNISDGGEEADTETDEYKKLTDSIATMISTRTGKSMDEIKKLMNKTTWISADEALAGGFCDNIEPSDIKNVSGGTAKAMWREGNKILNKIFDKPNIMTLTPITNKLGLSDSASEASIEKAIDKLQTENQSLKDLSNKKDSTIEEKEAAYSDIEKECKKLKEELENMKKEKAEVDKKNAAKEAEECENKASAEITNALKDGKLTADEKVIGKWKAMFKTDFAGTKDLLDSIPVNKNATVDIANLSEDLKNKLLLEAGNKEALNDSWAKLNAEKANKMKNIK